MAVLLNNFCPNVGIVGAKRSEYLIEGYPIALQQMRVKIDLVLHHVATDAGNFGNTGYSAKLLLDSKVLDSAKFR
ncbi:hypothetical protein SDC9_210081 [bioreactor metagenome]|uniref:Uncharacterized protein n=1 Tax=bioreactor metagenome TaxID=1076179 RepID=A0A645JPZ3_9ZZZZ